jgi:hypothetical protein
MGFLLDIDYRSSSYKDSGYETLFLGEGWGGVRDVRGPYMTRPRAVIAISAWALSARISSQLHLHFGLSNRCPVDALIFNIAGRFGASSHIIRRSSEADIILEDIIKENDSCNYQIDVTLYNPETSHMLKFIDILSIDQILIRRDGSLLH